MISGLVNATVGIWLIVSVFFWVHTRAQFGVAWACGIVAGLVGLAAFHRRWGRYLNAVSAMVLLTATFNLRPVSAATLWNHLAGGILLLALTIIAGLRDPPSP
jgi:hypothetical protein